MSGSNGVDIFGCHTDLLCRQYKLFLYFICYFIYQIIQVIECKDEVRAENVCIIMSWMSWIFLRRWFRVSVDHYVGNFIGSNVITLSTTCLPLNCFCFCNLVAVLLLFLPGDYFYFLSGGNPGWLMIINIHKRYVLHKSFEAKCTFSCCYSFAVPWCTITPSDGSWTPIRGWEFMMMERKHYNFRIKDNGSSRTNLEKMRKSITFLVTCIPTSSVSLAKWPARISLRSTFRWF